MPVTKKKGAIFAIYADSPGRNTSPPSSRGSTAPRSPSKRAALGNGTGSGSRKALSSLQPTAVKPSSSSSGSVGSKDLNPKSKSALTSKTQSTLALGENGNVPKPLSQAVPAEQQAQSKNRTKSSITVFSDSADGLVKHTSTSVLKSKNASASSTLRRLDAPVPAPASGSGTAAAGSGTIKARRGPSLLPPPTLSLPLSTSQPTKRSRDLLSPLPIVAPTESSSSASRARRDVPSEMEVDAIGESPAKRNRVSVLSTPTRVSASAARAGGPGNDKENVAPATGTPDDEGSPATRTRSKIRALTISSAGQSPLRSTRTAGRTVPAARRTESLIGDGRGALTLKKGRELAVFMDADREREARELRGSPPAKAKHAATDDSHGKGMGKGARVMPDGALVDVSEAYGASGDEPEGFKTQRR